MGYEDERERIWECVTEAGTIIVLTPNNDNVKKYCEELEILSNGKKIAIKYPGYKTKSNRCDYCVCLVDEYEEHPVSHIEIMNDLYNKTTPQNYELMKQFIEDVAIYGKNIQISECLYETEASGFTLEELTLLMFYIAIQEDINYPEARYQGRKMCFYRYLEAIYCKVNNKHKIQEALNRAQNEGYIPRQWNDVGSLYSVVSQIHR